MSLSVRHIANPHGRVRASYGAAQRRVLSENGFAAARAVITAWPGYAPTPLVPLPGLAAALGIRQIWLKNEATRFGLGSFKALGGAYAVFRLLERIILAHDDRAEVTLGALRHGAYRDLVVPLTVTCASAGNHGKSVAWGAQAFGCRCVIYVAENMSDARAEAISALGAEVVRVDGTYDDAVRRAAADAERHGRHVISDTSYAGYRAVPRDVMHGYGVMAEEIVRQLPTRPTHVFVQCGVGGLAAAVCAYFWQTWGTDRPRFVAVEPDCAACLYESMAQGRPAHVDGDLATAMTCLACGDVSLLAWDLLRNGADDVLTIPDAAEEEALALLRNGVNGDEVVALHGSGAAGLAGLLEASRDPALRAAFDLNVGSRVVVIGSEGLA